MSLDATLLRETFTLVVERAPDVTGRFYDLLFARHPEVVPLFGRTNRRAQEEMLTKALVAVIEHLDDPTWLTHTLRALGAKHVGYGVTEEMYPWVADALLSTLEQVLADAWSAPVREAWTAALGAIAGAMIDGARASVASPPSSGRERAARL